MFPYKMCAQKRFRIISDLLFVTLYMYSIYLSVHKQLIPTAPFSRQTLYHNEAQHYGMRLVFNEYLVLCCRVVEPVDS